MQSSPRLGCNVIITSTVALALALLSSQPVGHTLTREGRDVTATTRAQGPLGRDTAKVWEDGSAVANLGNYGVWGLTPETRVWFRVEKVRCIQHGKVVVIPATHWIRVKNCGRA